MQPSGCSDRIWSPDPWSNPKNTSLGAKSHCLLRPIYCSSFTTSLLHFASYLRSVRIWSSWPGPIFSCMPGRRIISCALPNATQSVTNETTCDVSSRTGFFIPRIALSYGGGRNGKAKLRSVYLVCDMLHFSCCDSATLVSQTFFYCCHSFSSNGFLIDRADLDSYCQIIALKTQPLAKKKKKKEIKWNKKLKKVSVTFYIFAFSFLCRAPYEICGRHTLLTTYNPTFSLLPWAPTPPQFLWSESVSFSFSLRGKWEPTIHAARW